MTTKLIFRNLNISVIRIDSLIGRSEVFAVYLINRSVLSLVKRLVLEIL